MKLAFSSCPNDTFMFNGIVSGEIPLPCKFELEIEDIAELNRRAAKRQTDITKLSYFTYFQLADNYIMLNAGAALGRGCGPLVISKKPLNRKRLESCRIAVPGLNTTAYLLFKSFCPECRDIVPMLFSGIEQAILDGSVDAGVIIHETRFTYRQRGLTKVADLGEWWEKSTGHPIPLGCIAVKRELAEKIGVPFDAALRKSVKQGLLDRGATYPFVRQYAKELGISVINAHIDLYVNHFSIDIGEEGRAAVRFLFKKAVETGAIPRTRPDIFLPR
ncbi:MAG: 1,4-dihydroxy-6-naphthoate synthase [Acidobacteria bacterium]|nr:1,4-dihydroxy-6-naphthoate synthase [Acidobacteriota bacterium]